MEKCFPALVLDLDSDIMHLLCVRKRGTGEFRLERRAIPYTQMKLTRISFQSKATEQDLLRLWVSEGFGGFVDKVSDQDTWPLLYQFIEKENLEAVLEHLSSPRLSTFCDREQNGCIQASQTILAPNISEALSLHVDENEFPLSFCLLRWLSLCVARFGNLNVFDAWMALAQKQAKNEIMTTITVLIFLWRELARTDSSQARQRFHVLKTFVYERYAHIHRLHIYKG